MNNNGMRFDPNTGQPLQQMPNQNIQAQPIQQNPNMNSVPVQTEQQIANTAIPNQNVQVQPVQQTIQPNQVPQQNIQMQGIPTVEQSRQEFVSNTQANTTEKKEAKKSGINYALVIILFVVILAAIYFLFPILMKYI